jgi:hypothetical protein
MLRTTLVTVFLVAQLPACVGRERAPSAIGAGLIGALACGAAAGAMADGPNRMEAQQSTVMFAALLIDGLVSLTYDR